MMVIYGYGLDINEQDELEARRFRDAWNDEQYRIYKTITGNDREMLMDIYKKNSS